jgi:hypothetical protein
MQAIVKAWVISVACCLGGMALAEANPPKVRLFILSGQSNMARLDPDMSFTPAVKAAFPGDEVIVVKSAQGGQPIRRWYKEWRAPEGAKVKGPANGDLYETLQTQVKKAIAGKTVTAVTFIWMQGERDAKEKLSAVYGKSLGGLIEQVRADLGRKDVSVVIGRLSDCNLKEPHWQAVREAQVAYAEKDPLAAWVDTDDLNGPDNALHYTRQGYAELGKRFAAEAVRLQNKAAPKK